MACVVNVRYVFLINGIPTPFFKAARGLRQGCSLSPLVFILVMESLSLHIKRAILQKRIKPLPICREIHMSYNLFVDDILLSALLCRTTWSCIHEIMVNFQKASGLCINDTKSFFYVENVNGDIISFIIELFNIKALPIKRGLKYLGFNLKLASYRLADWAWITDRFYKRISTWEYKCLSLGGRTILTQVVLAQIMFYWALLFYIPSSIIKCLNHMIANFIWGGQKDRKKYHLCRLSKLSRPNKLDGWGILDLHLFRRVLLCKSMWNAIMGESYWSKTIRAKYMKNRDMTYWYR